MAVAAASSRSGSKSLCDVKVSEEILPDGTIHQKVTLRRNSVPTTGDPQQESSTTSEILETFEMPPQRVQDLEQVVEVLPDGTKVTKQVSMSRMVHSVKTHRQSFDEGSGERVLQEEYELEEVIPGTVSAFDAGCDSDYEDEMAKKGGLVRCKHSIPRAKQHREELGQVLPDGTTVKRSYTANQVVQTVTTHSETFDPATGHVVHNDYAVEEVIPNTTSAFESGLDSDYDG